MKSAGIPGLNVQWPWSQLLISKVKTVETRSYPLPERFRNIEIALIETPGHLGRLKRNNISTKIVGTITFSGSYQYSNLAEWKNDFERHRVPDDNPDFKFVTGIPKWAWVVSGVKKFDSPKEPPVSKGYVFAKNCLVDL